MAQVRGFSKRQKLPFIKMGSGSVIIKVYNPDESI